MNRRLIVNADDFGFTRDVNAGIVHAHRHGILTATTLMPNGDAFDDAVALARDNPSLDVGIHLVFVQGRSVFDAARELPPTLGQLIKALARGRLPVYKEASAQIRRLRRAGIHPTHLDTHKHTHLLPPVLDAVAQAARDFGIPWVRRPFDSGIAPGAALLKSATAVGMRVLRPRFTSALRELRATDHFTGFQLTGTLNEARLIETLKALPDGLTELMCHPGYLREELRAAPTRLKESREIELAALTSAKVRETLEGAGIQLTSYRSECR